MQSLNVLLDKVFPNKSNIGIKYQAIGTNLFINEIFQKPSPDMETPTMLEMIVHKEAKHIDKLFSSAMKVNSGK